MCEKGYHCCRGAEPCCKVDEERQLLFWVNRNMMKSCKGKLVRVSFVSAQTSSNILKLNLALKIKNLAKKITRTKVKESYSVYLHSEMSVLGSGNRVASWERT